MIEAETRELREEILKGLILSFEKLVSDKKKTNSELAFAEDEKVITVKAVDI
jgi:hypothetical protein